MLKTILFYTGSVCVYKKSSIHIKRKPRTLQLFFYTDISQKTTDGGVSRPISRLAALASSGSIAFRRDKRRGYKYALSRRSLAKTDPRSSCLQNTTLPHDPSAD